jgi:hypothetical protein
MKIEVIKDLTVACSDGIIRYSKPGEIVSVYHVNGRRLLYARMAKWIGREIFDPIWDPPAAMKAAIPQLDKMVRGAMNKGAA